MKVIRIFRTRSGAPESFGHHIDHWEMNTNGTIYYISTSGHKFKSGYASVDEMLATGMIEEETK